LTEVFHEVIISGGSDQRSAFSFQPFVFAECWWL